MAAPVMDLRARMAELAKIGKAETPLVSVYLDTRWSDEHQRNRVRIFFKNEIAKARETRGRCAAPADLEWVRLEAHQRLAELGGVAAPLRYPL